MLKKEERLKDRSLFNKVFSIGKRNNQKISSSFFLLYFLLRKKDINRFPVRLGFVVGTKVDKRATKRNLIKRRMKAAYKAIKDKGNKEAFNKISVLIWIANPSIKNATFKQIEAAMKEMIEKLVKKVEFVRNVY